MYIHCLGLNHATAGLDLRERLAFRAEEVQAALARLGCGEGFDGIQEMVILSTCNRVELYAVMAHDDPQTLLDFLTETRGVRGDELRAHTYHFLNEEAAHHLFSVAAGLDSLVIGEPQILGQVVDALELARGQGTTGTLLNRLFRAAIHAGKRARTETHISRNSASVATLAATLAERTVHDVRAAQIVILGAGEMAELTVEALRKRGAQHILVVNRTLARARSLAERWGAQIMTFERLEEALLQADILISSTGAPHTLIQAAMVGAVMAQRAQRALVMIDIAVPRDIAPVAAEIPGVWLYDMDSLDRQLQQSLQARQDEIPHVEAILQEELDDFAAYLNSLDMLPLIAELGVYAERIRQNELEKTLRHLPNLSPAERKRVEKLTQALVKKLLAPAIQRLKSEAGGNHAPEYATVVRTLFPLEDEDAPCSFSDKPQPMETARDPVALPTAAD